MLVVVFVATVVVVTVFAVLVFCDGNNAAVNLMTDESLVTSVEAAY